MTPAGELEVAVEDRAALSEDCFEVLGHQLRRVAERRAVKQDQG
jgi:hypothetical protein